MKQMMVMIMTLPVDYESKDYNFYKNLNEDVELIPVGNGEHYDVNFENDDYVNLTGKNSLSNAIVIAILTRFTELSDIEIYEDFGCKVHDLIKANQEEPVKYEIELYVSEVLKNMRRIKEINYIEVNELDESRYGVQFSVTSVVNDEIVKGELSL